MLWAAFHIVGAVLVLYALWMGSYLLGVWESTKIVQRNINELSLQLGISEDALNDPENSEHLIRLLADRFSSERFVNRFSDFLGIVRMIWSVSGTILQAGCLIAVIWSTFKYSVTDAKYAWLAPVIGLVFWISSVLFAYLCKLLTGRFPGEASRRRRALANAIKEQELTKQVDESAREQEALAEAIEDLLQRSRGHSW